MGATEVRAVGGGSVIIRERGNRLLVWLQAPTQYRKNELYLWFRDAFGQHRRATWRTTERCWSLPLSERRTLEEFLASLPPSVSVAWGGEE